jgi:DNA-3-methyladenine glycosylase II
LFAEGRPDIWPAGDLAIQEGMGRILGLPERPSEKAVRAAAEGWRPHRGAVTLLTWHCYNTAAL